MENMKLLLGWFNRKVANKYFLKELVNRASRIKECKVTDVTAVKWHYPTWSYQYFIASVENGSGTNYTVILSPHFRRMWCDCEDFQKRAFDRENGKVRFPCKHILAVIRYINRNFYDGDE